jgi:serine/threonine-protein kinase
MLVGEPPFTGPTAQAIIARHSMDVVSPPSIVRSTIPDAVEGAVLRALSKVPADRYPTTALFAEALNTPSAATGAYRRATLERAVRRPRRGVWRLAPVAVVLAALAGYLAIRSARAGRGSAVSGLDPRHIAVLYFTDQSSGHALGYLADGLTEALIDALRPASTLTVVSKNGVGPYRSSSVPLDSLARALGVGTIVQGGVDEVGGRYRVSVNLIDGASGADLGTRASFEQPAGAVLAIRDSLASKVAEFLRARLGEELRLRQEQASTQSVPAWSLVQQGERARKDAEDRLAGDDVDGAFSGFARADSLLALAETADPSWVDPVTRRGWLAYRRARLAGDRKALIHWVEVARGHAERACTLAQNDARALELRGTVRYLSWLQELAPDPGELPKLLAAAKQDLEAATRADPSLASAYSTLSHLYYQTEDVPAALLAARKAYEEDAYLSVAGDVLARLFFGSYDLEQLTQARRWCLEGAHRFPGDFRFAECRLWLMTTPDAQPDLTAAWRLLAQIDSLTPAPRKPLEHHRAETIVGVTLARAGLADSARHVLHRARADRGVDPGQEILSIEAFARTILGDRDDAIALLQRYIAANPSHAFTRGGDISWWWRDLKADPRFAQLAEGKR